MSQKESNSPNTVTSVDVQARFDQGIRDGAQKLTAWQATRASASSFTLTFLVVSAFYPLLSLVAAGGTPGGVVLNWLAGLGGNALAGWLAAWSERETRKILSEDKTQEQALIEQLVADLQNQLAGDEALRADLEKLLDQTDGIVTAIEALALQSDTQTRLIEALRGDIRQSNLIQGQLHRRLTHQLDEAEARITTKIEVGSSLIVEEVRLQAEEMHTRLSVLSEMHTAQNSMLVTQDSMPAILNSIVHRLPSENTSASSSSTQGAVEVQIGMARKFAQEGHFTAARKILIELQEQSSENEIAGDSRARIANLLGCCAFATGELHGAQTYFKEAITLEPNNISMITNCAMVALIDDNPEEALEYSTRARNLNQKDPNASSAYIQALHRLGRREELEEFLTSEPWIIEHAVGIAALASIKYEQGNYQEAEALLRHAISLDTTEPQLYVLLANSLLAPLKNELNETSLFDESTMRCFKEAEEAFSQAVTIYERGDNRISLHAALVSRAGIRIAQNKLDEGLIDCDRVLIEDAMNRGALENKGRIFLDLGRGAEAIRCFEDIIALSSDETTKSRRYKITSIGGKKTNISVLLAYAYMDTGQFTKAIDILSPLFVPSPGARDQLDIAEILLIAQSKLHNHVAVTNTIRIIEETWPKQPETKAIVAEYFARQGNYTQAITLLQEAAALAEGSMRSRCIVRIAHFLYQDKRYEEAADILRPVVEKRYDNSDLRLYIVCLYNSQQLEEALPLTQLIRSTTGVIPGVSEIEALIFEKGGDVKQARQIWQQLIEAIPTNISYQVNAAYIEWRAGNREAAQRLILGIPYDIVKNNAALLINIANLRVFLDLSDVLVFAYQARRVAFHNPDIHVQYMMLCLRAEELERSDAQLMPNQVGVDTAVHLTRNGKTTTFLIVDDEPVQNHQHELHINDPLAQKLLGRRIGERITLQEGFVGAPDYEITGIQGKYVYASHQTTYLFEQGSLRHPAFYVDDVNEPDFAERFVRFLNQRAQFQPDIQALYTEKRISLSTFAHMIGRSIIDVWLAFIESPGERIFSATGTTVEADTQGQVLAASSSVVIDLLSLLTIAHLSLEEVVARRFDTILMPQALLDLLQDYEQELTGPQPRGTIGSSGGQQYFLEIPPEYGERKRELLNKVLAFVRSMVQVRPTMGIIEVDPELVEMLGEAATASILLAKEQNVALYSDDLWIRIHADKYWQVEGFDSQTILKDTHNRAIMGDKHYYHALSRLAQSNYHFVRIDVEALVFILEKNSMAINEEVRAIFKLLHGPDCEAESAISVVAELIKKIWIRQMLQHQKFFILDLALTTLFTGRKPSTVIPTLKKHLRQNFRLIEFKLPEILVHVDYWGRQPLL